MSYGLSDSSRVAISDSTGCVYIIGQRQTEDSDEVIWDVLCSAKVCIIPFKAQS